MQTNGNSWSRGLEDTGTELDGLRVTFDQKVALFTANLQKKVAVKRNPTEVGMRMTAKSWARGR